jgi:hypothetical protein
MATTLPLSFFEVVVKRTAWKSRRAKMIRDCDKDDKEARLNIEKGERSKWLQLHSYRSSSAFSWSCTCQ